MDHSEEQLPTIEDYHIISTSGEGAYGKVLSARCKMTNHLVAIKKIEMKLLIDVNKVGSAHREKQILKEIENKVKFAIRLITTFKDDTHLFFVFEYCPFGTINELAEQFPEQRLPFNITSFYGAQMILFLESLHKQGIIHRDFKPENILIGKNMHIKVIDFGDAKYIDADKNEEFKNNQPDKYANLSDDEEEKIEEKGDKRKDSFVGSPFYVSPEMLKDSYTTTASDFWALGCVFFKLIFGEIAFNGSTELNTFDKILARDFEFPIDAQENEIDLINKLLNSDPEKRLTDIKQIQSHPFFKEIEWDSLHKTPCPFADVFPDVQLNSLLMGSSLDVNHVTSDLSNIRGDIIMKGALKKKNKFFMKNDMYFTLANNGEVCYYKDQSQLKGTFWLTKNSTVQIQHNFNFEITIPTSVTANRTIYLIAKNQEEVDEWVKKLKEVIGVLL